MGEDYRELIQFVDRRAGDAFRAAFSYTAEDWTALSLRDDVTSDLAGFVDECHRTLREQ